MFDLKDDPDDPYEEFQPVFEVHESGELTNHRSKPTSSMLEQEQGTLPASYDMATGEAT